MPDDILTLIDRAITHQARPDALACGYCGKFLALSGASLDFCGSICQEDWGLARTDGYATDTGKGYPEHGRWQEAVNAMSSGMLWLNVGADVPLSNERQSRLVQRWIEEDQSRNVQRFWE